MNKFNISYSSYSLYKESQLLFYYTYVIKAPIDTQVPQIYGDLGTLIHSCCESFIKDNNINVMEVFEEKWKKITDPKIKKSVWLKIAMDAIDYVKNNMSNFDVIETEKYLNFYLKDYLIKGYIDVYATKDNEIYLFDWKTNSSNSYEDHKLQRLFYSWMSYKINNTIPKKCTWYYIKDKQEHSDSFTLADVQQLDEDIHKFIKEVTVKADNINNYELGSIDGFFNAHKKKCLVEKARRESTQVISCTIEKNKIKITNEIDPRITKMLDKIFTYDVQGAMWSDAYKKKLWDGKIHMYKNAVMPLAYINKFERVIKDFNEYYKCNTIIEYEDKRNKEIMNTTFDTKFKVPDIDLRYYQTEAVEIMLKKKFGIVAAGTGSGKTIIAAELIRRLNKRCLLLVNRIELAKQTQEEYEKYLGVEIGLMTEGNLSLNQIVVASVQTINAILDGDNKDKKKQLLLLLANINVCLWDESHNLSKSEWYKTIQKYLINNEYCIGFSGTPFRNDGATLQMNAVCGFVEYTKSSEELQNEGYLVKSKCYFLKYPKEEKKIVINGNPFGTFVETDLEYHEAYDKYIVNSIVRNSVISKICETYKDKKILILVNRVSHGQLLKELIPNSMFMQGATDKEERKDMFAEFKDGTKVLIGMSQILSTGINIPSIDIMINCGANKSDITTIQSIGRVLRKSEGKEYGIYIDFVDFDAFNDASVARFKAVREYGHDTEMLYEHEFFNNNIYK